jgi:hypothetical protein
VDFSTIGSIEEGCARLGRYLGLGAPVSRDVFVSVVEDPVYANNLYLARTDPAFVARLVEQPTRRAERGTAASPASSSSALVARAARSLAKWTRAGFRTVEDDVYRRRLQACHQCPHHVLPPDRAVYQIALRLTSGEAREQRICELCECFTASKAQLEHEQCPDPHPERPGFTRWGEPQA